MKLYLKGILLILILTAAVLTLAFAAFAAEEPVSEKPVGSYEAPEGSWAPSDSTVTYALFATEEDYLNGKAPLYSYTDKKVTSANIIKEDAHYLHFFSSVTCEERISTLADTTLKINLGGHTYTTTKDLHVSTVTNSHAVIVNGSYVTSHQFKCGMGNSLVFENVNIKSSYGDFGYALGGNLVRFKDCNIELSGKNVYIHLSVGANGDQRCRMEFINTDITVTNSVYSKGLFRIDESKDYDTKWDVFFDKDSSIKANITNWVTLNESTTTDADKKTPQYFKHTQRIVFEEGFCFGEFAVPSFNYTINPVDKANLVMLPLEERSANDSICKIYTVKAGTEEEIECNSFYATVAEGGFYNISTEPSADAAWYYKTTSDSKVTICSAPKYQEGIETPIITLTDFKSFAEGSFVTFRQDITFYNSTLTVISGLKNSLTFDFGGNTFFCSSRINLNRYEDSEYKPFNLTMKNGTLYSRNNKILSSGTEKDTYVFYGNTDGGKVLLENVDIDYYSDNKYCFAALNNGDVTFKNCNISVNGRFFDMLNTGKYRMIIDGCNITAGDKILYYVVSANTRYSQIEVTNSTLTTSAEVFWFSQSQSSIPEDADLMTVKLSGSRLKGKKLALAHNNLQKQVDFYVSDSCFSFDPFSNGTDLISVDYGSGETLNTVSGGDYTHAITSVSALMYTNLTLKSDFIVNFYIPCYDTAEDGSVIAITVGGESYTVNELKKIRIKEYGEVYVLPLTSLAPDSALEKITYDLTYVKGGMEHTATVSYLLVNYIKRILASDFVESAKQMTVSAVEYIAASYALSGKTAEGLDALMASEDYKKVTRGTVTPQNNAQNMAALSAAVSGAQLDLGATNRLRFNLNESYTGTLKIGDFTYEVTSGKVGAQAYVELDLPAYTLYDTVLTVTAEGIDAAATYSLSAYAYNILSSDVYTAEQKALVSEFFSYCYYASLYNALYE